jgi:hypothetical protein
MENVLINYFTINNNRVFIAKMTNFAWEYSAYSHPICNLPGKRRNSSHSHLRSYENILQLQEAKMNLYINFSKNFWPSKRTTI